MSEPANPQGRLAAPGAGKPDAASTPVPRAYRTVPLVLQPPDLLPLDADGYRAAVAALARLLATRLPHDHTHHD